MSTLQIISLEAILNGILPEVLTQVLHEDLSHIVKYLTTVAVYCSRPFCCLVACRCLATVMNKFLEGLYHYEFYSFMNSLFEKWSPILIVYIFSYLS